MAISLRGGGASVREDRAFLGGVPLYDMDQPPQASARMLVWPTTSPRAKQALMSRSVTGWRRLSSSSPARFAAGHHKAYQGTIPAIALRYQSLLSNVLFLDPVPARMREYSFVADKRLLGEWDKPVQRLFRLWGAMRRRMPSRSVPQRAGDPGLHPEPARAGHRRLAFLEGPRGEVMVQLLETFGYADPYDASLLSDGTLRVLAIAAAMLSAPEG